MIALAVLAAAVVVIAYVLYERRTRLPDFAAIADTGERKAAFYGYVRGLVEAENARILVQRRAVAVILERLRDGEASARDRRRLARFAELYDLPDEVEPLAVAERLLRRVDILPADLVLVQAAIESGWGRSRFAVAANNLFGIRCFSPGCGVTPAQRPEGAEYEVRWFDTPGDSVAAYMYTLNTHAGYDELRRRRADLRAGERTVTGLELAGTLAAYSTRRDEYVEQVKAMLAQYHAENAAGEAAGT